MIKSTVAAIALLACTGAAQAHCYGVPGHPCKIQLQDVDQGQLPTMSTRNSYVIAGRPLGDNRPDLTATKADIDTINRKLDWIISCLGGLDRNPSICGRFEPSEGR